MTTLDDLREAIRDLTPTGPVVASFMVASDVWAKLRDYPEVHTAGDALRAIGFPVREDTWLPLGWIVPLDMHGMPIPKDTPAPGKADDR